MNAVRLIYKNTAHTETPLENRDSVVVGKATAYALTLFLGIEASSFLLDLSFHSTDFIYNRFSSLLWHFSSFENTYVLCYSYSYSLNSGTK